jgi:xylan 1,4-beta-xylosidase
VKEQLMKEDFQFEILTEKNTALNWHQELEIIFILQGSGWLYIEGNEPAYRVKTNDIFVINSFQKRNLDLDIRSMALSLRISNVFLTLFCPEAKAPWIECKSFLFSEKEQLSFHLLRRNLAHAFQARFKRVEPLSTHLRSQMALLLDNLFRSFMINESHNIAYDRGHEHLRKAIDYIHRNYKENISLLDLAGYTYLSTSYISRSFKKYLGVTFTEYLVQVRLFHALSMLRGNATITEIAYETGFSNASSLIEAFKNYMGITPGQYRREGKEFRSQEENSFPLGEEGRSDVFASLLKYAEIPENNAITPLAEVREIEADALATGKRLVHNWKRLVNAGYARDLLDTKMQQQVLQLQNSVGFEYIRCKGILDDDMLLYSKDILGKPVMNYVYIDEVVDFILSAGAKPFLELSHMPSIISRQQAYVLQRPTCISAPSNLQQWQNLIEALMSHLVQRYGKQQMKQWLFAPWTTPDFSDYGLFTLDEYMEIYRSAYNIIKETCTEFRICGAGCSVYLSERFSWFLDKCMEKDCMPDILSFHSFAAIQPNEEPNALKLEECSSAFSVAVSGDEFYLSNLLKNIKELTAKRKVDHLPILLDEWSNNIWQRDLCNDTSYKSAYIFKSILENYDRFYGMGYFNIGDQLDEVAPAPELFHGGFGLFTRKGLPKSAYRAMELLGRVGDRLLSKGNGWFITSTEDEIQIFLYSYCHYDLLYRYRHTTNLTKTERYKVFLEKQPQSYHIRLDGLKSGTHTVRRYSIGPEAGSTYDAWLAMGAPEPLTQEEENQLLRLSYPHYYMEKVENEHILSLKASLKPHEVQLITVKK